MQEENKTVDIDTSGPDVEVELPEEKKEQSSNSTPKVKYALAEKYDKENKEKNKKEVDAYERLKSKDNNAR